MTSNSIITWANIDPVEAETRLANLHRREADLEEAFLAQQRIEKIHPGSFALSLAKAGLNARREFVYSEMSALLRHRINEPITIKLDGVDYYNHSAKIGDLGFFLIRLQKLFSSIAQAIQTGPTLRGPIASSIREATEIRIADVFPSSFGMDLYVPVKSDLMGRSISSESLSRLFQVLASSQDEEQFMKISGSLGGRTTNHLRHLVSHLKNSESKISMEWRDHTGTNHSWKASSDVISGIANNITTIIQTKSSVREFSGVLVGASMVRNSFELLELPSRDIIEGTITADLALDVKKYFGSAVNITVDAVEVLDKRSGVSKTYYALTSIG
ncbi:hypothetical protein IAI18_14715 [Acetobacteraceae bacterium H6797]|nr:hypothetical protein [Acetobacteraceae bacterium H6797]